MSRKTFNVQDFKKQVNYMLKNTPDDRKGERHGARLLVESVLHGSGNYMGFRHLTPWEMDDSEWGTTYGVNHDQEDIFAGTDQSRVQYL